MARSDRRQREFETREQDILDAALELFSAPNWESVTIEQVAERADIGKGTLYKHFASKDELLFRLMMQFYRGLLKIISARDQSQQDVLQQFRDTFEQALRYHVDNSEYRFVIEYCNRIEFKERAEEDWHQSFMELDQAFSEWGDPRLNAAMGQGLIQRRPLEHIQMGMHACFHGATNMLWAGKDWCPLGDNDQILSATIDFMMAGLIGQP